MPELLSYLRRSGVRAAVIAALFIISGACEQESTPRPSPPASEPTPASAPASPSPATSAKPPARTATPEEPAAAAVPAPASSAPTFKNPDEAFRALLSAWDRVQAFAAKLKVKAKRNVGTSAYSEGNGTYRYARTGEGFRIRYIVVNVVYFRIEGDTARYFTPEHIEIVTDGKTLEHMTLQRGRRQLVRKRFQPDDLLQLGGRHLIDNIRSFCDIKSMKRDVRDGRDVVTFSCRYEDGGSATHTFDVATGIRMEWAEYDPDGEELLSIKVENLNLAPEFSDDDFRISDAVEYTFIDETGPVRKVIPWEELSKTLPSSSESGSSEQGASASDGKDKVTTPSRAETESATPVPDDQSDGGR